MLLVLALSNWRNRVNKDLTEVVLLVDRSGSMVKTKSDAEGGIQSFITEQGKAPGSCRFTLIEFNTNVNKVYDRVDVRSDLRYTLVPQGNTALLDALGYSIDGLGDQLARTKEENRPGLVVFVVVTDGEENSSRRYSRHQIKTMIEHQQSVYSWKFLFLGANQDAIASGQSIGIAPESSATYSTNKTERAFTAAASSVSRARHSLAGGQSVHCAYTAEERKAIS
jgi:uncharacterized protein YegL